LTLHRDIGLSEKYAWTSSELLVVYGLAFPETGFIRHPAFLHYAQTSGLMDVWDKYGPPEWCSKANGEWVCE